MTQQLTMQELEGVFKSNIDAGNVQQYNKFGTFPARPAVPGELIETVIDGKLETKNYASVNSWVLTGASGEQYIVDATTLFKRYDIVAVAKGSCWAYTIPNETSPFSFTASWGETMIAEPGDMIASTSPTGESPYRIEKGAFVKTYKPA